MAELLQKVQDLVRGLEGNLAKTSKTLQLEKARAEAAEAKVMELSAANSKLEARLNEWRSGVEQEVLIEGNYRKAMEDVEAAQEELRAIAKVKQEADEQLQKKCKELESARKELEAIQMQLQEEAIHFQAEISAMEMQNSRLVDDLRSQIQSLTASKKELESILMRERQALQASRVLDAGSTNNTTWKARISCLKKELDQARSERDMYKNMIQTSN